jgi:uncharacterized protein YndB with AHSA1/START domain
MKSEVKVTGSRLQITRVFDAPRAAVFSWWSHGEKMQQWSGCKDATACEIEMDFRAGGSFTQKMSIADKCDFTITGIYDEIIVPEKISYHVNLGGPITQVTVEFFEQGERTKVILTQDGFPDDFSRGMVSQGTQESLEKLDAILAKQYLPV